MEGLSVGPAGGLPYFIRLQMRSRIASTQGRGPVALSGERYGTTFLWATGGT
jgi:hypothetical protein